LCKHPFVGDDRRYTRRQILAGGLGAAAAVSLGETGRVRSAGAETVRRAAAIRPAGRDLDAIRHVVFLMQENRSFDHYFGKLGGVAGFDDLNNRSAFMQAWPNGSQPVLLPFHLNTKKQDAECTYDLSHSWPAEHASWNNGAMNAFVSTHTASAYEGALGVNTMGYYNRRDIPFYYDLVEHFTVCDQYFCSVLGPTHPNRLMQMTGSIDPAGVAGGPILVTNSDQATNKFTCSWETMPEVLQAAGVTWKCYNPYGPVYQPGSSAFINKNVLLYFKQYSDPTSPLYQNAFGHYGPNVVGGLTASGGPNDFAADVANNTLPQVSWILSPDSYDEHPPAPAQLGEWYTLQILNTLLSNPTVWASTVLFIMYDENDGWFDHVPPPTAPAGTDGEYLTADPLPSAANGIAGPVGLGVRVPMIVVSPFSVGGWVCSDIFDHTSQLLFLQTLFGVKAPNVSSWRRSTVGDLTTTLPTLSSPVTEAPALLAVSDNESVPPISTECNGEQILELNPATAPYPIPKIQRVPTQRGRKLKPTPRPRREM
jgi:phospholipase C